MLWISVGGALVALAGAGAVALFMRRRSVDRRSMYASRRSQIEHKVRAARQRTLAPHGRSEKPAEQRPGPSAPATFGLKEAMPTIRYEPSAFEPPPAAPPPLPAMPGGPQPPWQMSAAAPAAPPPPPPPPPPPATEFAPAAPAAGPFGAPVESMPTDMPPPPPPPPPSEDAWAPPPPPPEPEIWVPSAPPPEQPWTPGPAQYEQAMPFESIEPEPMTIPPPPSSEPEPREIVVSAGWSVVASETKSDAITSDAKPSKKAAKKQQDPHLTESWLLAAGGPEVDEANEAEPKQNLSRALATYAILVVGLVMVLIGVIVMVANSH